MQADAAAQPSVSLPALPGSSLTVHAASHRAQALPLPPRGSGFDARQPEEVELWQLAQGMAREREYHLAPKRKAGGRAAPAGCLLGCLVLAVLAGWWMRG